MNKVPELAILLFVVAGIVLPRADAFAALDPRLIISLTNGDRASYGVPVLAENALLDEAAQMKADDMAAKGYYSHITPEGYTPFYWFDAVGYRYLNVGENLDVIYFGDEGTVNDAWMGSPEHRANILLPQFTEVGAGVASGLYQAKQGTFIVELFATPLPPPSPLKPVPPSSAPPAPPAGAARARAQPLAPPVMIPAPSPEPAAATSTFTPRWALFQIQYNPQRFVYSLQTFILSIQESTRQFLVQLSPDGVY